MPASVDANRWISHALQKQAIEVVVMSYPLQLNHTVFTSRYLRRIGFSRVSLDQGFFKQLDVGCPVLDDLFLHWCTIADDEISSQTLKVLTIDGTQFSTENKTTISTPSVTSLTLSCLEGCTPILNNMPLLMTASVSITCLKYVVEFEVDFGFDANDLRHNLWSLSAAKKMEFIYEADNQKQFAVVSGIHQCVNMTLGQWCLDTNFYPLIVFLQNSPRLEKLTLKLARCNWEKSPRIFGELTERSFTCEYLKIVEVICLEDDPQVISVKDFFVNSGMPSVQFHIKHWSQLKADKSKAARLPISNSVPRFDEFELPRTRTTCSTKRLCDALGFQPAMEAPPVKRGWRIMAPAHAGGREDRLSDLPEGVLHRLMSFLDSRQAVRTCVLSRRWRDVWRTVPRVHADFCDFTLNWTSDDDEVDEAAVAEDEVVFNRFVNRLLELRDPNASIRSFFLRFCRSDGGDDGSAEGNRWISYALQKNVRVLEVAVLSYALELDHSVFSSRYLKTIDFSNVVMDQGFFKQLEMGCPELEELFLDECFIVDDEISSQTLKVLALDATHFCCGFKTSISSPSITSLGLHYPMSGKPVLNDMEALVSASLLLCHVEDDDFDASDLRDYLWSLYNVEILDFSYHGKKSDSRSMVSGCQLLWTNRLPSELTNIGEANPRTRNGKLQRIIGQIEERSFTCEHLTSVEVICLEDDPLVNDVVNFFVNSGMSSVQIHIKKWSQTGFHARHLFDERRLSGCSAAMEEPPGKKGPAMDPAQDSGRDWLSGLPEGVLHRIMSFLDSRQAVRTCVLSRRWRDLWRSVPRVHADIYDFTPDGTIDGEGEEDVEEAEVVVVFNRFVNRLLERRDPTASIETFFFRCCIPDEDDDGSADANRWISYGLLKNAWFLEVVVQLNSLELDRSVFNSIYLRIIAFGNVFMDQGFFKQLQMGCPALERLYLDDCIVADDEISSNTLKVLTFDTTEFCYEHRISISTPTVTTLALCNTICGKPVLKDVASLVSASVVLYCVESGDFDANDLRHYLWSFSHVKDLIFSYQGKKLTIENNLQWCPKFFNLVGLTLGKWCLNANFYALIVFLQNSPRLEKLTLILAEDNCKTSEVFIGELEERSFTCEHSSEVFSSVPKYSSEVFIRSILLRPKFPRAPPVRRNAAA
uniref:F-box domain-containing protein n=1 Tax=Oryza glumipatula TaxID=40148 RepID=A0A0E0B7G2_9ORYZ